MCALCRPRRAIRGTGTVAELRKGFIEVGTNGAGEVVINHPDLDVDAAGVGHIVFSPAQAEHLAGLLKVKAAEARSELAAVTGVPEV